MALYIVQWPYTTHGQCTTAAQPTAAEGQQKKRVGSNFIGGTGNANLLMTKSTNISVLLPTLHHKRTYLYSSNKSLGLKLN